MNRVDAKSTRRYKLAGVGEGGEVHRGMTVVWRCGVVDGNDSPAVGATAKMRSVILIERKIPQNNALPQLRVVSMMRLA